MIGTSSPTTWSRLQDKLFEQALVLFPDETPDRWSKIAAQLPGKTAAQVAQHYEDLIHDLVEIDSGRVEPPSYEDELDADGYESGTSQVWIGNKGKERESERRKGVPWTEEEHRLFLIGLQTYGKGDWRSISRNAVVSRTPTQVASHAQKYFLRLNSGKKDKKRSSIHDITASGAATVNGPFGQGNDQNWNEYMDQSMKLGPSHTFQAQARPLAYHGFGYSL